MVDLDKYPRFSQLSRLHKSHRFRRLLAGLAPIQVSRPVLDRFSNRRDFVLVGSAHKVGSTWLDQMLEDLLSPRYSFEGMMIPKELRALGDAVDFSAGSAADFLKKLRGVWQFKSHCDIHPAAAGQLKIVTVHRDIRDMCVSATHFCTSLGADQGGYAPRVQSMSFSDRLQYELEREYNLKRAEYWWNFPGSCRVKYESLKADPVATLIEIGEFLGYRFGWRCRCSCCKPARFQEKIRAFCG